MKFKLLAIVCLLAVSCSSRKAGFQNGDLVKIKNGKDVFRINEREYRKPKAYANWNSRFYEVTHTKNGRHFSLPERSLVLIQRTGNVSRGQSGRMLANDADK